MTMQKRQTAVPPKYRTPDVAPERYDGQPKITITIRYMKRRAGIMMARIGMSFFRNVLVWI